MKGVGGVVDTKSENHLRNVLISIEILYEIPADGSFQSMPGVQ